MPELKETTVLSLKLDFDFRKPSHTLVFKSICHFKSVCHFNREAFPRRGIWLLEGKIWVILFDVHKCEITFSLFAQVINTDRRELLGTEYRLDYQCPRFGITYQPPSNICLLERKRCCGYSLRGPRNSGVQET